VSQSGPGGRRREVGAASARSLLLTVLGEFVLPHQEPAWTGALVSALGEVGIEEKAARQALTRTAGEDLLSAERDGRRVRWHLTERGTQLLTEGTARIYSFGRTPASWDGRWLALAVSVPESQRQLRHLLRTRLTWAGLGSPSPGIWVTPDAEKDKEVAEVVASLGVDAYSFIGPLGSIGDPERIVAEAWQLDEVEQRYRDFLESFASSKIGSPAEAFRSQVRLVQAWRRFPFLDPGLPAALLPAKWPGHQAADLFYRRHDRWHASAQAYWESLMSSSAQRL
jgi:phenylacetic acid degradation operon negative regulatory protein